MTRFEQTLQAIDVFNDRAPQHAERPFSERVTRWVETLNPQASEPLRIAARGQHIGRWTIPRESYPMDRGGYLRWREELKKFHAKTVGELMVQAGYAPDLVARTQAIVLRKTLHADPDAQTLEDALCLVFLEFQFSDFRKKVSAEKMIDILRKSWRKMSDQGRQAALTIAYGPEEKALIEKALAAEG